VALILAILIPVVAALGLLGAARQTRDEQVNTVALAASVASLAFTGLAAWTRPEVNTAWVPSLGLRWHFAVDGIGVPLVLLTALLTVAVVVQSRGREPAGGSAATFYACILLVEFGALATFLTRDAIGFFIAFELVLVPMWALINRFGDEHQSEAVRADASYRFIFFTALGSTLMLIGIIALVSATGTSDLTALASARGGGMDRHTQVLIAALLVAGLGIKAGAHVAPPRPHRRPDRRFGAARRRPAEDGDLRHRQGRDADRPGGLRGGGSVPRGGRHGRDPLGGPRVPRRT